MLYRHGQSNSPTWTAWRAMVQRCTDPGHKAYLRYGGSGVHVCDRWRGKDGFKNFLADVGPKPGPGYSLDRFPNQSGNYEPGNVRWATAKEQARNRRNNRQIKFRGEERTIHEWAEVLGFNVNTLKDRLLNGWDVERALSTPPDPSKRNKKAQRLSGT